MMFTYLFFLTPQLIYEMLPISILVAVLAAFGVMSKQNEITAFKACGVSLFRLAAPILVGSVLLSGGLFAFDFYYVAERQPQTGRAARRDQGPRDPDLPASRTASGSWATTRSRIFNYKYFDNSGQESSMNEASVFELEPEDLPPEAPDLCATGALERAAEDLGLRGWLDVRVHGRRICNAQGYAPFQATTFPNLTEPPDYFLKEALQDKQMNFLQLERYITGPDAERLRRDGRSCRCGSTASSRCRCSR